MVTAAQQNPAWLRRERERVRQWRSKQSRAGRDIGRLPACTNPHRRRLCAQSLARHATTYHAASFYHAFSADHLRIIKQMETAIRTGGLFALAMPRGTGKTTLAEVAAEWAILNGYCRYVVIIGATASAAAKILDSIKLELATNDELAADYPEVCHPIRALEGINNRAAGQLHNGQATRISLKAKTLVLPTIKGSLASGAIVEAHGLTASLRGLKRKLPDGQTLRPDLVIPDDPQTDRSAANPDQVQKREDLISGAVLGLAGPGQKLAAIMLCTVIRADDLSDRFLNRELHPEWNGIRTKTLYAFPSNEKLWQQYAELRAEALRTKGHGKPATDFYKKNRAAMDAGAQVAWPERHTADEASALEAAMIAHQRDPYAFAAEGQNEPKQRAAGGLVKILTAKEIATRCNHCPRGEVPAECHTVTAFIDIQQDALYWLAAAWAPNFSGAVVDYGTWPEQDAPYFTLAGLRAKIKDHVAAAAGLEGQIYAALKALVDRLAAREFRRQDGATLRLERIGIDANWGRSTKTVYQFARQSAHGRLLVPCHGHYVGAASKPMSQYAKKDGQRLGDEWIFGRFNQQRATPHLTFDTNHWKSFVHARLATSIGDPGALQLCGDKPAEHRLLADHLVSETATRVEAKGRTVDEWKIKPERPDNHFFDGLVGAAVLASLAGCTIFASTTPAAGPPKPRRRAKYI